ncbi:hypothetical protein DFH28DRAFT_923390 [Melampsora americana]|nr:hypothetical protein DFH28DRAFT_923390 [Melampsora americana]
MCDSTLPVLHTKNELLVSELLEDTKFLTISLDTWTDCSKSSIYANLALKGTEIKELIDILNLHHEEHTSENTHGALNKVLQKKGLDGSQACAVVTDSPSPKIYSRWRKEDKIGHGLMTACETCWCLMAKVFISVSEHEANQALVTVLKSVVDAIGQLEHANTTLANIWKEVLHVYCAQSNIDVYS